ncbi:MAG: putative lipid II flippase FtsW [Verrucomicrobiota bacterium]
MQRQVATILLICVLGLVAMGLIMLLSIGGKFASGEGTEMWSYFNKQAMWLLPATIVCIVASRWDYQELVRYAPWILGATYILLLLVFVPGLGREALGAYRWISVGGFNFQPSELAKVALVLWLAYWLSRQQRNLRHFVPGFLIPAAVLGTLGMITVAQHDLGVTAVLCFLFFVVMWTAGAPKRYLLPIPPAAVGGILTLAVYNPERMGRLMAFMDPEKYKMGDGFQPWQALVAFGSGGPIGVGLGNSRQKFDFLPEPHSDFIFPILGEELGLWMALAVVTTFLVITLCGGWISLHAPDSMGIMVGTGITAMIAIQATVNLMVVTSMMPTKGMPLPFISYGGSNLVLCFGAIGVLFNIARQGVEIQNVKQGRAQLPPHLSPRM